ncbi:MAG: sulfotransferase [Chlorobia bacterium]|nr:sulfotransferase [Fimbriimonadaceae bacterium]
MSEPTTFSEAEVASLCLQRGQIEPAAVHVAKALEQEPENPQVLVLASMIEARREHMPESEALVRQALEIDPKSEEALIFLSRILATTSRLDQGIEVAESLAEHSPNDAELSNHLGLLLVQAGRFSEAVSAFQRALSVNQNHLRAMQNLAAALSDLGNEQEAIKVYEQLTKLDKNQVGVWVNFSRLLHTSGRFNDAVEAADQALRLDKVNQTAHLVKALALVGIGRGDEAELHLHRAVKFDPNDGLAKAALGYWYQEKGKFAESLEMIEEAMRLIPNHGFAYFNYLRARNARDVNPSLLADLEARAKDPETHVRDAGYMNYALGKAYEDLEDYESAIRYYDEGNRCAKTVWLAQRQWDREAYQERITQTIETFDSHRLEVLKKRGSDSEKPLIIVGMMRSGTSLLEQILSSHPEIVGAGELQFWHEFENEAYDEGRQPNAEKIRKLADRYLADLEKLGPNSKRITDKMPHNYAMLGLIHAAFPDAKIIHVKRNPADNCLSIYTTAYQRPPMFAHDRKNIVSAYREYQRIVAHWREVLPPNRFMEVEYEGLVADRDNLTRQLIEFTGLEWDEACLHHEKNQRSVRTPSLWQVRQPIYKTSIERWRRFKPWIPEFAALAQQS